MKTKITYPVHFCIGCRKYLDFKCDILGEIDEEKIQLCKSAGYREFKQPSLFGWRWYHWKTGAE